ncbi:MAG: transporter [Kordia sp.]|nr:MAG: transporter [Kordia sp.]
MKKLLSFVLFFLAGSTLYAGGYRVSIQGQKQLAMGHTGVAVISSAESVFFNPASISFLDGKMNFSLGVSGIIGETRYENKTYGIAENTNNPLGTPFNVFATYKANNWLSFGLGIYTPYGSSVEWEKDWAGSHLVNNIELKAIFVQPTIALKISDQLSIGGGAIYANGSVNFNKNLSRSLVDIDGNRTNVTIKEKGISAWGYTIGIMIKPIEKLNIGFNYRSKVDMVVEGGETDFENVPSSLPNDLSDGTFNATLPMPAEITAGISYEFCEKFLFAFDYNFAKWSEYEALTVEFSNDIGTSTNPRNYKDSETFRFGLQYKACDKITLRTGVYFDESPVQDGYFAPETPRNDSVGYTGGLSYKVNDKLSIDASFLYLHFEEIDNSYDHYQENGQNVPFEGTYKSSVIAPGIGISYKL